MLDILANILLICIVCEVNGIKWLMLTNHQSTAKERNCYSEFPAYRLYIIIIIIIIIVIIIIIIMIIINILILLL